MVGREPCAAGACRLDETSCLVGLDTVRSGLAVMDDAAAVRCGNRAKGVRPEDIPSDVITMNARLRLTDLSSGAQRIVTLVYPQDAHEDDSVSILSPPGTALLGYRVGDEIRRNTPTGPLRLRIDDLLQQPEAAGDFRR